MGIYQPFSFFGSGLRYRSLVARLARRRVADRYRGSLLGGLWIAIHPILMLCVYTFVFSVVFRARWNLPGGDNASFALFLFSGLAIYTIFSECILEAPRLVLDNRTFIKQLDFPVEVLCWVSLLAALVNFAVSAAILVGFHLLVEGLPPATALLLPLVLVPVALLSLGLSWLLSSLGTFLRDLSQVTGVATTALLFLSPIFYPVSAIPETLHRYYYLNPFTSILEMARGLLFQALAPDWVVLGVLTAAAWAIAWLGFAWFMKTKGAFPDVL